MKSFLVINYNFNGKEFEPYDIMPHLMREYDKLVKRNEEGNSYHKVPETEDEFRDFVKREALHQWWSRCEYEIILKDWPSGTHEEKWDVYKQLMMNIDLVVETLMYNINEIKH